MRIVIISDTHGLHKELSLPEGDLIIHAGDITDYGTKKEVRDFLAWYSGLNFQNKVMIGGNHDTFLDDSAMELLEILPPDIHYLNNSGTTINGVKIWGSPVSPDLVNWAFGKYRKDMEAHWKYMPEEIDILLTHTPPKGILDKSSGRVSLGCANLLEKVETIKPKYHIFGHIHASYGKVVIGETTFINASNMNSRLGLVNPPFLVDYQ